MTENQNTGCCSTQNTTQRRFTEPIFIPVRTRTTTLFDVSQYLLREPKADSLDIKCSCTVVIPVYNGIEHLIRLFPSIVKNTPEDVQILVVNDASPAPEIRPYIQSFVEKYTNWRVIENEKNAGFVYTVNRGMAEVHTDYAILLNTDTVVPKGWIQKMLTPFEENEHIATTTPFTNAGVYFSFPVFGVDNYPQWDLAEINEAFSCIVGDEYALNEIFSGTGFCMGVNMACWNQIGGLDYENFGKGYGEENDWCFRALEAGWRHLLVPNLFVHHYHGGSFLSEEKKKLCEQHQGILRKKYPQILLREVPAFQKRDPWKVYRAAAALKLCASNTILFVDLKPEMTDVSGAVDYSKKELSILSDQDCRIVIAHYIRNTKQWSVVPYSVDPNIEIMLEDVADLIMLFDFLNIRKVIINNLAFCENAEKAARIFARLRERNDFELIYKCHDYLSVCPSFFLINKDKLPCNPQKQDVGSDYCKDCLRQLQAKAVQRDYLAGWRSTFDDLFNKVDSCCFFSDYSKAVVCGIYSQLCDKAIVKYHEPLLTEDDSRYSRPLYKGTWNIAFVGNFCMEKGAEFFLEIKKILQQLGIGARFIVIGTTLGRFCLELMF